MALDGLPKHNLTRFNQAYFDRLRSRAVQAGARGMYVSIMLFNGFSVRKASSPNKSAWQGHYFYQTNNINGVNGDLNADTGGEETHELLAPAVTTIQEAYVRKVIDTVNDLDNVLFEVSNESHSNSQDWQYRIINIIRSYEATLPKQHPVGMTVEYPNGSNADLFASPADWVSPNGDIAMRPITTGAKVVIADTDHLCGVCGDGAWVWRSVTAGENLLFMDPYDRSSFVSGPPNIDVNNPDFVSARRNMGFAVQLTREMDLARAVPRPSLSSSGYCLADTAGPTPSYLVFRGGQTSVTVDLRETSAARSLDAEWLNTNTGERLAIGSVAGGAQRTFSPPSTVYAVLFLRLSK